MMKTPPRPLTEVAAHLLTLDTDPWLSCDDCFRLIDQYIELLATEAPISMPTMQAHLIGCSACLDEAQTLAVLVSADIGIDPELILNRLTAVGSSAPDRGPIS